MGRAFQDPKITDIVMEIVDKIVREKNLTT